MKFFGRGLRILQIEKFGLSREPQDLRGIRLLVESGGEQLLRFVQILLTFEHEQRPPRSRKGVILILGSAAVKV